MSSIDHNINLTNMIKPKKSARELWNQLGLRNHIKQTFEEKETTWG